MTLEEVLNEHPEIQGEIDSQVEEARNEGRESGVAEERERIRSLDAIRSSVTDEMLEEAKYGENPVDGRELAYQAMAAGRALGQGYIADAIQDSQDSNAPKVGGGAIDAGEPEDKAEDEANALSQYVNKKHGYGAGQKGETR